MVIMAASTSSLAFQPILERIAEEIERAPGRGRPADYIPALAARDPRSLGMAIAELDGTVYGVGHRGREVAPVGAVTLLVAGWDDFRVVWVRRGDCWCRLCRRR
ncbi:hypothetical protein ACFWJ1_35355, partial [Streptomyces cinereoruber]